MGYLGVDYSTPIPAADLVAANVRVAFRYITDPVWPKSLTQNEVDDLRAHGIRIVLLDEQTADYMEAGYYAGRQRARERRARAAQLGFSDTATIFYSLDISADQAHITPALEFLRGAYSVAGGATVGAYGEYDFVRQAADAGYPTFGTVAWSGGRRDPRAVAWQNGRQLTIAGVDCDLDDLNPSYFPPGDTTMGTIPPSIAQKWPELAGDFPANGPFTDESALIWADGGARAAALFAQQARDELRALAARIGQAPAPVDAAAIASAVTAALRPELGANVDLGAVASIIANAVAAAVQTGIDTRKVAQDIVSRIQVA